MGGTHVASRYPFTFLSIGSSYYHFLKFRKQKPQKCGRLPTTGLLAASWRSVRLCKPNGFFYDGCLGPSISIKLSAISIQLPFPFHFLFSITISDLCACVYATPRVLDVSRRGSIQGASRRNGPFTQTAYVVQLRMLQDYALFFIRKDFTCCLMSCVYMCVYACVCVCNSQSWISPEKMPFVVEGRGKENIVHVKFLSRERLVCISIACVVGNALILSGCLVVIIDAKRKNARLFAGIRCTLRYLTEAVYRPLSNLRGSKVQVVKRLVQIQSLCARSRSPCIRLYTSYRWDYVINPRRACARGLQCLSVCVCLYHVFCHHAQQTGQKATLTGSALHWLHFKNGDFRKSTAF